MAFGKELAILYGFFNLIISNKIPLQKKRLNGASNFFLKFCLIVYQTAHNVVQNAKGYVLNQSRSILLILPKYSLENQKIWSFFIVSDEVITQSRDLFLVSQKLIMLFYVWAKFHFIWLSVSDFTPQPAPTPPNLLPPPHSSNVHKRAHSEQG